MNLSGNSPRSTSFSQDKFEAATHEKLLRVFNTAIISTAAETQENVTEELLRLTRSPAFKAILRATGDLANDQNISEKEAAELLIHTFREVDKVWSRYVFLQGVDLLKKSQNQR